MPKSVDGFQLKQSLARDATSQLWRGQDLASGAEVFIRRLVGQAGEVDRLRARLLLLQRLDQPHLALPLRVAPDRGDLVVVDPAGAGMTLSGLLSRRGRLRPDEVRTIIAPIAAALHQVHVEGFVHGNLSTDHLVFTSDGRPLLLGLVRAFDLDSGGYRGRIADLEDPSAKAAAGTAQGDVYALAALTYRCLTGRPVPAEAAHITATVQQVDLALARILAHTLSAPGSDAALFADAVAGSGRAEPVCLPPVSTAPQSTAPASGGARHRAISVRRRGSTGPLVGAGALAVLAALVAWVGVRAGSEGSTLTPTEQAVAATASGSSGSAPTTAAAPTAPDQTTAVNPPADDPPPVPALTDPYDPQQWLGYLDGLYRLRSAAVANGQPAQLSKVFVPDSPAYQQATAQISALTAAQAKVSDYRPRVVAVSQVLIGPASAKVTVIDEVPAYTLTKTSGGQTAQPGRGKSKVAIELRKVGETWLVWSAILVSGSAGNG